MRISSKVFNFFQFLILSMLCMYKETPEVILSVNFGVLQENFVNNNFVIYSKTKPQLLKEECEAGSKKLRKNLQN